MALEAFVNKITVGHSAELMRDMPDGCVDLIVTSPPYWTAVEYESEVGWPTYQGYLDDMLAVWRECARVLRPNGKLCINTPILPIPKDIISQHTRHLKNIAFDIDASILTHTDMARYSVFVWQKQTSKLMFGSYPYPGNILENNTIEFINVYVKPGKPPKFSPDVKAANKLDQGEWVDLTQQIWFMYPEDIKREGDHPAPFPEKLPARLIRLYTFGAAHGFEGELVLDPFVGTGTTCAVAKSMGRRFIGFDISQSYADIARDRIANARPRTPLLLVGRAKYPSKDELIEMAAELGQPAQADAVAGEQKHKRKTYGRGVASREDDQLDLL